MLKAARALFAHIFARAKIHNDTGALPQPPSGEQCSPEPQRAAEYVRAIGAFAKINFHAKVFSLTPLTQYILVPTQHGVCPQKVSMGSDIVAEQAEVGKSSRRRNEAT